MKSNGILGFYLVLVSACMKPVDSSGPTRPTAVSAPETVWNFELRLETDLVLEGVDNELSRWLEASGTTRSDLSGRIVEGPYRVNQDGTESWRLLFEEVLEEDSSSSPLEGKALETRRFPGGVLLSVGQSLHASGQEGMADALDPLVALLYLLPPEDFRGESQHSELHWPFRVDSKRRSQHSTTLSWTKDSEEGHFSYTGALKGRIQDRVWGKRGSSTGSISGRFFKVRGSAIEHNAFEIHRVFRYEVAGGVIQQTHRLSGEIRQSEGEVVSPWPRPFYLEESEILSGLHALGPSLESCAPSPNWETPIRLQIERTGKVSLLNPKEMAPCGDELQGLRFPAHHQNDLVVQSRLVFRDGVFQPYPKVSLPDLRRPPLHLVLEDAATEEAYWERLTSLFE